MKMSLTAKNLRNMYLSFFEERGHKIIASSSLIPENDPTVLFTTAGMHPLTPYLLGQKHPSGRRLTDVQKCVRTGDIDEVGDSSHCTFFEMLGNWSLGDYFKEQSIKWSWEFLTSEKYLNLPKEKLAVTVFCGDENCERDEESAGYWRACGIEQNRIFYLPKKHNWWGPAGLTGPCGPDTEIFYYKGENPNNDNKGPADDGNKWLEIWNNVFMQYHKNADGTFTPLEQKNVDTGMGLERTVCVLNGFDSVYDIDVFKPIINRLEEMSNKRYGDSEVTTAMRIIADHVRTAVFMIGDQVGITPSNVDQGYVLRRIIRRAVRYMNNLSLSKENMLEIAQMYIDIYKDVYSELQVNQAKVLEELAIEQEKFLKTLIQGEKEFKKVVSLMENEKVINGDTAFRLYDTFGFPIEMTVEYAKECNLTVDTEGFKAKFMEHQAKSHAGSEQRFKGGLADNSDATARLHTATHLLQASLRKILGDEVKQKGSNITAERLRFDFSFHRPLTQEEIDEAQRLVNDAINRAIPVECEQVPIEEARNRGAMGLFGDKYGEIVKLYTIGDVSMEICGGPHANNTAELGHFTITKEQSSSSGVRRIKAEIQY
ncbi:MAG: alanine--tRNA ligase [Clostridia bacterium]